MLKLLFVLFALGVLFVVAWPLALLMLVAAPFILLACLAFQALGFVAGGILHMFAWAFAVVFAIGLAVVCLPLALIF